MSHLTRTDRLLCALYGVVAVVALIGTQIALFRHIADYDGNALTGFISDSVANPAATFGFIDLIAVAVAALVFIVVEGRRLRMRFLWAYVAATLLVAISVALPVFLLARQLEMAKQRAVTG